MRELRRRIAWWLLVLGLAGVRNALAQEAAPARPLSGKPAIPAGLPRYEMDVRLEPEKRLVTARETVTFTNRASQPTPELIFHVYPRYKVPDGDRPALLKTLEVLRLSPDEALDGAGRRLSVSSVRQNGKAVKFTFDPELDTILIVSLAEPVAPGKSVTVEVDFTLELPDVWGRWGMHQGIVYLANWYPVLAHHDDRGWERTPFVPWHQPWHQEAGLYKVRLELPEKQVVASSGTIQKREPIGGGRQRLTIEASPARDFALTCSDRFQMWEAQAGRTTIKVTAIPEYQDNAQRVLRFATEVIPIYEQWFGPYADDEFEVTTSFFGWNGNECSGLVLLDDRVMRLPSVGERYLDHLVTHETCHQWWWNVVGSDGYAETFMDEGLVNGFTAIRLDAKYGRNAPLIVWPKALSWLPTIGREDLRLAGYYGWRARGGGGPVIQDLKAMGNLMTLFSLAYDRGGKVIGMIANRLGEARFFEFWRLVYQKYAWSTFHYEDLKRELAAFDPATGWPALLDSWLIDHADTDWSVERVRTAPAAEPGARRAVTIELRQRGSMLEPTVVECRCRNEQIRVPIWPERGNYEVNGARVERQGDRWIILVHAPEAPAQVEVDPDHALLDAKPDNNRWKPEVAWRLTPIMTPLDESSQFQAFDRVSVVGGPFIDQYARGGLKFGIQRLGRWQATGWVGSEPALREAIFGGQITFFNLPWPRWSSGFFYEEGLYNFYNDKRHSGGRAYVRYRILESPSFLLDDQGFAEIYYGLGNEFWAGDDGRPVNDYLGAIGGRYHLSTLFPYWDPVGGQLVDVTAEYGNSLIGSSFNYVRTTAEFGIVRPLPEGWGYLSRTRFAFRAYGGLGFPDDEPLFRLGGGRRLRALDLSQFLGSSVWLLTLEWRFPIWREINQDVFDHVLGFRNLFSALFYDVGQSFFHGEFGPVVHGVGVGFRLDMALFSFLERANLRLDLAQPIGIGTGRGPVLWFGLDQVF
jgi:Peptidase family M1 domain